MESVALVQSLALLLLKLVDDVEACAIAGASEDELDTALSDSKMMAQARAEAVKLTLSGGRAEVRATRALNAAAIRLEQVVEDPESRFSDVIAATNVLCTLAGTREKLKTRQLAPADQTVAGISYAFYLGGEPLNADEHRLLHEYRSTGKALVSNTARVPATVRNARGSDAT